jgi:hypothetical protein
MSATALTEFKVGDRVRATCLIWDDGADHHPPGELSRKGELLIVREASRSGESIAVSHPNRTDAAFIVFPGEIEPATADAEGREA